MTESGYTVTLRLQHPKRSPDEVSTALQMDPHRCWVKGSVRTSPHGEPPGGRHEANVWSRVLAGGPSDELSLARCLSGVLRDLSAASEFLQEFRGEGGQVELEIMWSIGDLWPEETFDHTVSAKLAEMKIDVRVSIIVIADS
ncbi:MAG: DUF4279 domain-containing protein [Caulobacteraceae bacterium]